MNWRKKDILDSRDIYLKMMNLFVFIIGLIFLLSFIFKAYQINDFFELISKYNIVRNPYLIKLAAFATLFIEGLFGLALISKYRQKTFILFSSIGILFAFSIIIIWGLRYGDISDCGCFSSLIRMSPEVSILKNIIMIVILFTYWGNIKGCFGTNYIKVNFIAFSMIIVTLYGIILLNNKAYPLSISFLKYKQFKYLGENIEINLSKGIYLVVFTNPTCEKCKEEIDKINQLNEKAGNITFIAFVQKNENKENELFTVDDLSFPYKLLNENDIRKYINSSPPQAFLLKDGNIIKSWADIPPFKKITSDIAKN
jgi:thiol-disulfide isomerase/thioredoxin